MPLDVRLRGQGRVTVAAYGVGDAEHLVEKEIPRLWPEARVRILDITRADEDSRIVEEFTVAYRLDATIRVPSDNRDQAPGMAFRHARGLLAGSRYARTEWECVGVGYEVTG